MCITMPFNICRNIVRVIYPGSYCEDNKDSALDILQYNTADFALGKVIDFKAKHYSDQTQEWIATLPIKWTISV